MTRPTAGRPAEPFRLDLEQQKKRAKELCRALRAGDAAAWARLQARHPGGATPDSVRLADAQLVVARELGLASWPQLRAHVERMARSRSAIEAGAAAAGGGVSTLHLRCGSDLQQALPRAGFAGDFLEYSNPFCQGPVPAEGDLVAIRAHFLAEAYGPHIGLTEQAARERLIREEEALTSAAGRYERVVLWFEHDHYDQLVLARVLSAFAEGGAPRRLEIVSTDRFPGGARFIGLGQLPPEALRLLWEQRRPLGAEALALGSRAWQALRAPDPSGLAVLTREEPRNEAAGLPHLAGALRRHLQELPWTRDGLALSERLALELIGEEELTIGQAFARLMRECEPRPWLGDLMFLTIVDELERAREAPLRRLPGEPEPDWPQRRLVLTEAGHALLASRRDFSSCGPRERWVGGVRIAADRPAWRWDEASGRPLWSGPG